MKTVKPDAPPLSGVRVLDFGHVLAAPFCTRLLADLGADVVRVESSKHPDFPWPSSYRHSDGRHASYLNTNRNKRSVSIDLKHPAGRDIARRLAEAADVVVENFSAGVMDRLGLGYESLRSANPRLVFASMSGYGHSGPRRDWTSMNMNLQGAAGLMQVTGAEGDPPTAISNSWNDYIGGLHTCYAVIGALTERETTGHGIHLDMGQFECSVSMIAPLLLFSAVQGRSPERMGNRSDRCAPRGVYQCAGVDQWCAVSVHDDAQWRALAEAVAETVPDAGLAGDARFATVEERQRHHDEIDTRIEAWTRGLESADVETRLRRAGVPAARMRRVQDLVEDGSPSRAYKRMAEPRVGSMLTTALPFEFSESALPAATPAPCLGQHTREVLREWLALPESELAELAGTGALV
ncbi:MAG: CoA transferase [Deltaproteobacteria bacterium]|nr:CoA transferase [Deltaproteobacteria bacterium]